MNNEHELVSRREFLWRAGISILSAVGLASGITAKGPEEALDAFPESKDEIGSGNKNPDNSEEKIGPESPENNVNIDEDYNPEKINTQIEYIKNKYNLDVVFPPTATNGERCTPWKVSELEIIKNTLDSLPEKLINHSRFPIELQLLKTKELFEQPSINGMYEGGYGNRAIIIRIASSFTPDKELVGTDIELYKNQEGLLSNVLIHEIAHSFLESNPELFDKWQRTFGWYQGLTGKWNNLYPEDVIYKDENNMRPEEDFAVSLSLFLLNPEKITPGRLNFLKSVFPGF